MEVLDRLRFLGAWRVPTEQDHPGGEEQSRGHPPDVERLAQLPSLRVDQQRVIEITNDDVASPGDGNQGGDAAHQEQAAPDHQDDVLRAGAVVDGPGALHPDGGRD